MVGTDKRSDSAQNLARQEHVDAAFAKRVLLVGFDGSDYYVADIDSTGALAIQGGGGGGTETIQQGTIPWLVEGTVTSSGDIGVTQATVPWVSVPDSTVSANNSFDGTLSADTTFTGTADYVAGYAAVTTMVYAAQDGRTDGMVFQFSPDSTNWDDSYPFTLDTSASATRRFQFPVTGAYYRVIYANGVGDSEVRIQTILHRNNVATSIHRLVSDVDPDRSAAVVKSALIAQVNGSGDFVPIQANAAGILKVGGAVELDAGTNHIGSVDLSTIVDTTVSVNAGTVDAGTQRIVHSTDEAGYLRGSMAATSATTTSYTTLIDNTASDAILELFLDNTSDKALRISFDGGTTEHIRLPKYSGKVITYGQYGRKETGSVDVQPTQAPSTGSYFGTAVI